MNYKIKATYQTGNSFGNNDTNWISELTWANLEIAKENLQAIKEHYEMYQKIEQSYSSILTDQVVFNSYSNKWWFVKCKDRWFVDLENKDDRKKWTIIDPSKKNKKKYKNFRNEHRWNTTTCRNCMHLKLDNGKIIQQWNPWCGYFERLYGAEIITGQDSDMKFKI